jgi:hypothetical protein
MWGVEGLRGRQWGDLTNVQYEPIKNWFSESPWYNEYILIKKINGKNKTKIFPGIGNSISQK